MLLKSGFFTFLYIKYEYYKSDHIIWQFCKIIFITIVCDLKLQLPVTSSFSCHDAVEVAIFAKICQQQ